MNGAIAKHEDLKAYANESWVSENGIIRRSFANEEIFRLQQLSNDSMVILTPLSNVTNIHPLCAEQMRCSLKELNTSLESLLNAIKNMADLDIVVDDALATSERADEVHVCFVLGFHGPSVEHSASAPLTHPETVNDVVLFLQASMQRYNAFPGSFRNMPVTIRVALDSAEHFLTYVPTAIPSCNLNEPFILKQSST